MPFLASFDSKDVTRKIISILKILSENNGPIGARVIAREMSKYGIPLSERGVRYHLKLMDERGLTQGMGRDGRLITPLGLEELQDALVTDKVGFILSKIELLAYKSSLDLEKGTGNVVVNTSLFREQDFSKALKVMKRAFKAGICVSPSVCVARAGEKCGDLPVPYGKIGLSTVCSVTINGTLLKGGIPMDSRFGGILQIKDGKPLRFVELIYYDRSTLDPSEIFIRGKMTSVGSASTTGEGKILANFREIPSICIKQVESIFEKLRKFSISGPILLGNQSEPVCGMDVGPNRTGIVLLGGLNPVATAVEEGFQIENKAMSGLLNIKDLHSVWDY